MTGLEITIRDGLAKSYWPVCRKCGRVVERLWLTKNTRNVIQEYVVECHGESEGSFIGIWNAFEIASQNKRLHDAFTK